MHDEPSRVGIVGMNAPHQSGFLLLVTAMSKATRQSMKSWKSYTKIRFSGVSMLNASLRRSGGSLIMTIPPSYVEQNHLDAGSRVFVEINGAELKVKPGRQHPNLSELLAAPPENLAPVAGWDEMPAVGTEL